MPVYYFHFLDGSTCSNDDHGVEFASSEEAFLQACAAARAMWPELLKQRVDPTRCAFEITDEQHRLLFRVQFTELIEHCRSPKTPVGAYTEIVPAIETSRARTITAHAHLQSCMRDTRRSLNELTVLLRQLDRYVPQQRAKALNRDA